MNFTTPLRCKVNRRIYGLDIIVRIFGKSPHLHLKQQKDVHPLNEIEHPENIFRNVYTEDSLIVNSRIIYPLSSMADIIYEDYQVTNRHLGFKRREYILFKKRKRYE